MVYNMRWILTIFPLLSIFLGVAAIAYDDEYEKSALTKMEEKFHVKLKERELPPRYNQCHFCHVPKSHLFVPQVFETNLEHKRIFAKHGDQKFSCNNCHDSNRNNYLKSTKDYQASFYNSSPVCRSCHNTIFRDWTLGLHGQRTGGWNLPKTQFHCINCHNPHDVKFKSMEAVEVPHDSRILKDHE